MKLLSDFVTYFEAQGHIFRPSSALIPQQDSSVLFTTAGMQQFKPYYLGQASPYGNRIISIQKCIRVDDIEEVGDLTHHTFFEMLGNFSFQYPFGEGSYFKKEAIQFGYEFIAEVLKLKIDYVTIFAGDEQSPRDEESYQIWQKLAHDKGINLEIRALSRKDNFWGPTGSEGPCGPTTEIFVNNIELWNIVFNEYYADKQGKLSPLEQKGVDTGGGLERILAQLEGVTSVYETKLFSPLIQDLEDNFPGQKTAVYRMIFDHIRASMFLLAEGIIPTNKEQGYILRRLLRKVLAAMSQTDRLLETIQILINQLVKIYGSRYPELVQARELMMVLIREEYALFKDSLAKGMKYADKILKKKRVPYMSGEEVFLLASTYGLSPEILTLQGLEFNQEEYEVHKSQHQQISRAGVTKKFGGHGLILDNGELKAANSQELVIVTRLHSATHLLHQALREVLGPQVEQKGSDITADRTRFDFSFDRKLSAEEIQAVEDKVNQYIQAGLEVQISSIPLAEAKQSGALYLNRNYPDTVEVYSFGHISKEICGGPHVQNTSQIGIFKIKKEEAVGRGIRRIRGIIS